MKDQLEAVAFHLTYILEQGAQGRHVLFSNDEIRHAFSALDELAQIDEVSLRAVQDAVRLLAGQPHLDAQRNLIESLSPLQRDLLILFYFQFLDRFIAARKPAIH